MSPIKSVEILLRVPISSTSAVHVSPVINSEHAITCTEKTKYLWPVSGYKP